MKTPRLHPFCHYVAGERLHYFLITFRHDLAASRDRIIKCLADAKLEKSCCGYFVFGTSDLLIRLWAAEKPKRKFVSSLLTNCQCDSVDEYLIFNLETWYQREIEKRPTWTTLELGHCLQDVSDGEVPPDLLIDAETKKTGKPATKFFVFLQDSYTLPRSLFGQIRDRIRDPKDRLFSRISKVSLYSYYQGEHRGVIVKGETKQFSRLSEFLQRFAEDIRGEYKAKTISYICSEVLKTEEDELTQCHKDTPFKHRREIILNELFRSHDCGYEEIANATENQQKVNALIDSIIDDFPLIFDLTKGWNRRIADLRLLYKWVVFDKNEQIISFLMRGYVFLERDLRETLEARYSKSEEEKSEKHIARSIRIMSDKRGIEAAEAKTRIDDVLRILGIKLNRAPTLGALSAYLEFLVKQANLSADDAAVLRSYCERLRNATDDRNKLMHGAVTEIFSTPKGADKYPWLDFVSNYIRLSLRHHKVMRILKNLPS